MNNGIKVLILEGADILKDNLDNKFIQKEYKGVFADSMLQDKLLELGLNIDTKNESTKDIIMLKFSYGYTGKEGWKLIKEIEKLKNEANQLISDKKDTLELRKRQDSREDKKPYSSKIDSLTKDIKCLKNEIKYKENRLQQIIMSKSKVREKLYTEGFHLNYYIKDKVTKEYKLDKTINYRFWFSVELRIKIRSICKLFSADFSSIAAH